MQTTEIQQKLEELRVLAGKFSSPQDAHKILEWASRSTRVVVKPVMEDNVTGFLHQINTLGVAFFILCTYL